MADSRDDAETLPEIIGTRTPADGNNDYSKMNEVDANPSYDNVRTTENADHGSPSATGVHTRKEGSVDDPDRIAFDSNEIRTPLASAGKPHLMENTQLESRSPNMAEFGRIPAAPKNITGNHRTMPNRNSGRLKHPNQMPLIKLSTVTMTSKRPPPASSRVYYNNYVDLRRPHKVVTWDVATNARPPLRVDMEGPTACSYTPRNKPLYETNAPSWSFGRKNFVEKPGGGRTSWEKTWFQSDDVWTQKVDFYSDKKWPAPPTHRHRTTIGGRLLGLHASPQHTFGFKRTSVIGKSGAEEEPSPNEYGIERADTVLLPRSPAYTHRHRHGGTCLWANTEITPGPGAYAPDRSFTRVKTHHPSFSIRGVRREISHELGPYAAI